jgi:hypothetical protein
VTDGPDGNLTTRRNALKLAGAAGGRASDGKIIVRCATNATNFIVDLIGFLGPDQ